MRENQAYFFHNKKEEVTIKKITKNEIKPIIPENNGTTIILQRNAKDNREGNPLDIGYLEKDAAQQTCADARKFLNTIIEGLTEQEREKINIMVVASNATLITPGGIKTENKRAVETAHEIIKGFKESLANSSLSEDQLLNTSATEDGGAIEISELKDLLMLENAPEFVQFLKEKYGTSVNFWDAYEEDREKETRLKMGAEGPEDIADRVNYALSLQAQIAEEFHKSNPDKRLIIWAVSHYDSISPFIKKHITKTNMKKILPVDHGAGITISINEKGKASCEIKDHIINLN